MREAFFTEPTTGYWQELTPGVPARFSAAPPHRFGYPVRLPDERVLVLPLRQLQSGDTAVASLIANQASHEVFAALADHDGASQIVRCRDDHRPPDAWTCFRITGRRAARPAALHTFGLFA